MKPQQTLRSLLFAPGNHPRRREKALLCGADAVILDLEDAVAATEKEVARAALPVVLALPRQSKAFVRINALDTAWWQADLEAVVGPGLDGVMLPKAEDAGQLRAVDAALAELERQRGLIAGAIQLAALVETARGLDALDAIAAACPRLAWLSYGIADYTLDLGLEPGDDEAELAWIRTRLVHSSRVAGLQPPVDSAVVQVRDGERFRASAWRARRLGLRGKLCLHPDQVPLANEVFSPSAEEIARAGIIVAAFEAAESTGSAAIRVGEEFVDYPVVARARAVLALARQIEEAKRE